MAANAEPMAVDEDELPLALLAAGAGAGPGPAPVFVPNLMGQAGAPAAVPLGAPLAAPPAAVDAHPAAAVGADAGGNAVLAARDMLADLFRQAMGGNRPALNADRADDAAARPTSNTGKSLQIPFFESRDPLDPVEAELWVTQVSAWRDFTGSKVKLTTLMTLAMRGSAAKWWHHSAKQYADAVDDMILAAFLERFAPQVRPRATEAREKLLNNAVRMTARMTVAEYLGVFTDTADRVPDMDDRTRIMLFRKGLTAELQPLCAVDNLNNEFTSFADLRKHVIAEEQKLNIRRGLTTADKTPRANPIARKRMKPAEAEGSANKRARVDAPPCHSGLRR